MNFLKDVYAIFGFQLTLALSTRPEKFLGEIETWDMAEEVRGRGERGSRKRKGRKDSIFVVV